MKIWGMADPRMLNRRHLLAEHRDIHQFLNGVATDNPDSLKNRFRGDNKWLILRHELLRIEMHRRYGGHCLKTHKTLIPEDDVVEAFLDRFPTDVLSFLTSVAMSSGVEGSGYPIGFVEMREMLEPEDADSANVFAAQMTLTNAIDFEIRMTELGFPESLTKYDTPWDNDRMLMGQYLALGDRYINVHRNGAWQKISDDPILVASLANTMRKTVIK